MFITPLNKMKVFNWVIRIQHLGCFSLANLYRHLYMHNISFCSSKLESKITKENNRSTSWMYNIRYCASRHRLDADVVSCEYFTCRRKSCEQRVEITCLSGETRRLFQLKVSTEWRISKTHNQLTES